MTGGGTGLGLVTANALADNGCKVYITGRRKEPLDAAARPRADGKQGEIIPIVADVSNKDGITGECALYQPARVCAAGSSGTEGVRQQWESTVLGSRRVEGTDLGRRRHLRPVGGHMEIDHGAARTFALTFCADIVALRDAISAKEKHLNLLVNSTS